MAQRTGYFDDGQAYEQFMGRWSRAAGAVFLSWLTPPSRARWLDLGCGTGVFTELVLDSCQPSSMVAVDPTLAQIEHARCQPVGKRVDFQVGDAQKLPFPDDAFDIVASALVINFIPDRALGLAEMRRITRAGGFIAGYVWDFAAERSPGSVLRVGLRQIGIEVPEVPGTADSTVDALHKLFNQAGLDQITTRTINVTIAFPSFDDFWKTQTPVFNPVTKTVAALPESQRMRLMEQARALVSVNGDGHVAYSVRANAIKARVPG